MRNPAADRWRDYKGIRCLQECLEPVRARFQHLGSRQEILEQIEVGSALVAECDQLTIDYCLIGQTCQTSSQAFEPF